MLIRAFVVVVIAGSCVHTPDKPTDTDKLQGTWVIETVEVPEEGAAQGAAGIRWVIAGDSIEYKVDGPIGQEVMKFQYRLDLSKSPKAIDLISQDGHYNGAVIKGIYDVEGDMLRLCIPDDPDEKRPEEFKPSPPRTVVIRLKREEK